MSLYPGAQLAIARIRWRSERLALSGSDCPVKGGEAAAQWLTNAADQLVRDLREAYAAMGAKSKDTKVLQSVAWINYKMSAEDAMAFQAWDAEVSEIAAKLTDMISSGYRLTFSYDGYNKAMQCSVICQAVDSQNYGKGMSTYARDWPKLTALVVFKHYSLFAEVWPEMSAPGLRPDFG
jgi:hypothetical protein